MPSVEDLWATTLIEGLPYLVSIKDRIWACPRPPCGPGGASAAL